MEKQSLICTRKTSFYTDNITSTLTDDSCIFNQLITNVCPVCTSDVLQTRTENFEQPKNDSIASESPETSCVFRSMHLHYTAILVFFQRILHEIWRIFPILFDIVVISDVPTRYLIFCTKQISFLSTTSGTLRDLSRVPSFSWPHGVSLFGNIERCVVVSFSGLTYIHESDVEHALCTFSGVYWDYFQIFRWLGCAKWKYCEKWHLPVPKIWNSFFNT